MYIVLEHLLLYHQMGVVVMDRRRRLQDCIRAANARRHFVQGRGGGNMYAGYMKIPLDIVADMIAANHIHRPKIADYMKEPANGILVQLHMALVYLSNIIATHHEGVNSRCG